MGRVEVLMLIIEENLIMIEVTKAFFEDSA
jgi:hypothetical protein